MPRLTKLAFTALSATLAIAFAASTANAQYSVFGGSHYDRLARPSCPTDQRVRSYRPVAPIQQTDVRKLDRLADQLAEAAKHLHEDAHQLRQDYEHSVAIEAYVDRLDRLNEHMHRILHVAARRGYLTGGEMRHISGDVQQVRSLAIRLDKELEHQRFDGARPCDFRALDHMRQVIAVEVFPRVRAMEYELNFRNTSHHDVHHDSHGPLPYTASRPRSVFHISRFGF